jgi:Uma2 family endonuclease
MATARERAPKKVVYPTSDGRPMAETDDHRDLMVELIETLKLYKADDPLFYVSGNLLVFYQEGDRRKHLAPDVFAVRGVPRHNRENYLIWAEKKGPEVVIELTSRSTRKEDVEDKYALYQNVLRVKEYFLFDPHHEYLSPVLQGYRLRRGRYVPVRPIAGRLPSQVLGLHLEEAGQVVRLYHPAAGQWLPTPQEVREEAEEARKQAEAKVESLRQELAALRRRLAGES